MKKIVLLFAVGFVLAGLSSSPVSAADQDKLKQDVRTAISAFTNSDSSMKPLFRSAVGYAVFPNVGKGGFVLGGAHGNGLVYEKEQLTGEASITQVTVGAQVGGQEFSEVIFFQNQAVLDQFKQSKLKMSAQVNAVAAAEGVSKDAKYVDGVMVFTKAKQGLMAEASVGGQKFKFKPLKK